NQSEKIGASESVKVSQSAQILTGGSENEKVGSTRITIAGAIKMPNGKAFADSMRTYGLGLATTFARGLAPNVAAAYDAARNLQNPSGIGSTLASGAQGAVTAGISAAADGKDGGAAFSTSAQNTLNGIFPGAGALAGIFGGSGSGSGSPSLASFLPKGP